MALTDQQLLLLDNLMYLKASVDTEADYETLGEMVDAYLAHPEKYQGKTWSDETIEKYDYILREIAADQQLCELGLGEVTNSADDKMLRGRCFIEYGENGEVAGHVVAFRGTGGSLCAWEDNFEGNHEVETEAQQKAMYFIAEELGYDDITVTGHSKGGNLAMYVTIMCGEQVQRCVSYDGQGFGRTFLDETPEELLEEAKPKIKSVSAHNDYVNILLTSVAGECYYVANEENDIIGRHDAYPLYKHNEAALDGNGGMFTEAIAENRDFDMTLLHYGLEAFLLLFPEDETNILTDLGGNLAAKFAGTDVSWGDVWDNFREDAADYLNDKWEDITDAVDYVGNIGSGALDSIGDFGGSMADGVKEIIDGNFLDGLGEFGEGFGNLGSDFVDGVIDIGGDFVEFAGEKLETGWELLELGAEAIPELIDDANASLMDLLGIEKKITSTPISISKENLERIKNGDLQNALKRDESIEARTSSHRSASGRSHGGGGRRRESSVSRER